MPNIAKAEPKRAKDLSDNVDPMCSNWYTDRDAPIRKKLRIESVEPICT